VNARKKVLVAMSGGVDSSAAALLLKEQGYEVLGASIHVWDSPCVKDKRGACCSPRDFLDARRVADHLGIPFRVVDFETEFRKDIIEPFIENYLRGRTPNPCVLCNNRIKFELFRNLAQSLGCGFIATGHYAAVKKEGGLFRLFRGKDPDKDQSYFLAGLTREQLGMSLFPAGGLTKDEVRRLAGEAGLVTADKAESQEICFVVDDDYGAFIGREIDPVPPPGDIVTKNGTILGRHKGIHCYTVGQRRGLGVSHPRPLYVLAIDPEENRVIVGEEEETFSSLLKAEGMNWLGDGTPPVGTEINARIRYRHAGESAVVEEASESTVALRFRKPVRAVTPGQFLVCYQGDEVMGGGWITEGM